MEGAQLVAQVGGPPHAEIAAGCQRAGGGHGGQEQGGQGKLGGGRVGQQGQQGGGPLVYCPAHGAPVGLNIGQQAPADAQKQRQVLLLKPQVLAQLSQAGVGKVGGAGHGTRSRGETYSALKSEYVSRHETYSGLAGNYVSLA